jgi:hypothetical protein
MRVDFIGIGAEKAATSWLYSCLIEHPGVCNPGGEKELHSFDTAKLFGRADREQSLYQREGLGAYERHFSVCGPTKVRGEFTVTYLHDTNVAPVLRELFPQVKLIAILRNPVDRAFSQYTAVAHMLPYKNFDEAIEREPEFLRRSTYAPYLKEYFDRFPREQILVLHYNDIAGREVAFVQKVYRFLGVDDTFVPAMASKKERTAGEKRLVGLRKKLERLPLGNAVIRAARALGIMLFIKRSLTAAAPQERLSAATRARLTEYFKSDIETTEKLTDLDLSRWK